VTPEMNLVSPMMLISKYWFTLVGNALAGPPHLPIQMSLAAEIRQDWPQLAITLGHCRCSLQASVM
jgi:hypothetical protein